MQNPAWQSLVLGQKYPLRLTVSGVDTEVTGSAAPSIDGGVWIAFGVSRSTLMTLIGSEKKMVVTKDGNPLITLGGRALDATYVFSRCANKMAQGDPFAR